MKQKNPRTTEDLARDIVEDPIRFAGIVLFQDEMFNRSRLQAIYVAECKKKTYRANGVYSRAPDYIDLVKSSGFGLGSSRMWDKKRYELFLDENQFDNLKSMLDKEGITMVHDGRLEETPEGGSLFWNDRDLGVREWVETYKFVSNVRARE